MSNSVINLFLCEWGITKTAQVALTAIAFACVGFIISSSIIKNKENNNEI